MNRSCLDCLAVEHACCVHDVNPSCRYCEEYLNDGCTCECVVAANRSLEIDASIAWLDSLPVARDEAREIRAEEDRIEYSRDGLDYLEAYR